MFLFPLAAALAAAALLRGDPLRQVVGAAAGLLGAALLVRWVVGRRRTGAAERT